MVILTLLAAEQRQHIAWGATSRATASVRETPGKQNTHKSSTCVGLAAEPPNRRRSKGGIACEPGAAACSPEARKPSPRLYAATAPQFSHAIAKIGLSRIPVPTPMPGGRVMCSLRSRRNGDYLRLSQGESGARAGSFGVLLAVGSASASKSPNAYWMPSSMCRRILGC